jgi:hypothetical protein
LFEVVGEIISLMHVLQLRSMCLIISDPVNILLGRREYFLNRQLGMEVYMKLIMTWRLE